MYRYTIKTREAGQPVEVEDYFSDFDETVVPPKLASLPQGQKSHPLCAFRSALLSFWKSLCLGIF